MGLKVAILGCGQFSRHFIPLFRVHPLIEKLALCDMDTKKLNDYANRFKPDDVFASFDALLDSDYEAVCVFTQPYTHAPLVLKALEAGKHVWSCVPVADSIDDIERIANAVRARRKIYYNAETSLFAPDVVFCQKKYRAGEFGRIVYSECEYYHDWSHLYDVMKERAGDNWITGAAAPPMWYPSHSVSMIVIVTGAHMTHVSCMGVMDDNPDGYNIYKPGNMFNNVFSNESALYTMSDGSVTRHNEFRRIGHLGATRLSVFGTKGSFENTSYKSAWVTTTDSVDITDQITCDGEKMIDTGAGAMEGYAPVHDVDILPESFRADDIFKGHSGAHPFLVHDFLTALSEGNLLPSNNIWQAARYMIPGLVAHESALLAGQRLQIPDLGDPKPF